MERCKLCGKPTQRLTVYNNGLYCDKCLYIGSKESDKKEAKKK